VVDLCAATFFDFFALAFLCFFEATFLVCFAFGFFVVGAFVEAARLACDTDVVAAEVALGV